MLVDGWMPLELYMSSAAPAWAHGRLDRIYSATLPSGRNVKSAMSARAQMERSESRGVSFASVGNACWDVLMQDGVTVRYSLRSRAIYHLPAGTNHPRALSDEAHRMRDFRAHVLFGSSFAVFPGDSSEAGAVLTRRVGIPARALGLRCVKDLDISPGTALRRWWESVFD